MHKRTIAPDERSAWGQYGEDIAAHWLERQGHALLTRNFSCKQGEIDLICQGQRESQPTLIFVEVRSLHCIDPADAIATIRPRKQRRILSAAQYYLSQHPPDEGTEIGFLCIGIAYQPDESLRLLQQWMEWF